MVWNKKVWNIQKTIFSKNTNQELSDEYFNLPNPVVDNNNIYLLSTDGNVLSIDKMCATAEFTTIEKWLELAVALEDVKGISVKKKLNDDLAFETIAKVARIYLQDGNTAYLDRGHFDKLDHLVAVNKPLVKNSYREHIVPLTMVINELFRMIKDENATNAQLVEMMKTNVKVYHITEKQAEYLDIKLGLRTTMPKDWKFGDDEFARIKLLKEAA